MLTAGRGTPCSDRVQFNLEYYFDHFGNKIYNSNIQDNCDILEANNSTCVSANNNRYNLTNPEKGKRKIIACKMDSGWFWGNPYCNEDEDNICLPPEGNRSGMADYYAQLIPNSNKVKLGFAPCGWNRPVFDGRIKNPDTTDGSLHAWSNAENVCDKRGIDPQN